MTKKLLLLTKQRRYRQHRLSKYKLKIHQLKKFSPAGNRTPVSRVTGGDTYHYTTEDTFPVINCIYYTFYSLSESKQYIIIYMCQVSLYTSNDYV